MQLHGKNIVAGQISAGGKVSFAAVNPANGEALTPAFAEAEENEINQAMAAATGAFDNLRALAPEHRAAFLERIAGELHGAGEDLVRRTHLETALPETRLTSELARTVNQIKMFANLVHEGSWVEARVDRAIPDRQPAPKPALKRMMVPIGPVVVFGASNFPLAFSVAGGDTISALAAGNPVIVKAHPAHPGTSEIAAQAIIAAVRAVGLPAGVFSLLHGPSADVGLRLVRHPAARSVAFTGSLRGGRTLFDAAAARPEPIPVYAEMGSVNPLFVLAGALRAPEALARGLMQSVTLGVGQFCTKPGLIFGAKGADWEMLQQMAGKLAMEAPPGVMLTADIGRRFANGVLQGKKIPGVRVLADTGAVVLATDAVTYRQNELLREEIFGQAVIFVTCADTAEMEGIARALPGQLTASVHGAGSDLAAHAGLIRIIEQKAGRLIFNGFPTGVEVCPAMHHGGPYPATTAVHFTSVGTAAIARFVRPVCFQNFPDAALPPQLRDKNECRIWRLIDGQWTKDDV